MNAYPGLTLCGTFRLLHLIGKGAMGSVWSAHHLVLDAPCAIKFLSKDGWQLEDARTRFLQEARTAARVDHPHVVRVLDYRVTEDREPFLVMELLRGETLEERIQNAGPLRIDEVARIVEQTAVALAASHGQGIVHRDVKADNIFLTAGPAIAVKLLDFGVAESVTPGEQTSAKTLPFGTPYYMSPERLCQQAGDERVDLWALAITAYYSLTGVFPFEGKTLGSLCLSIARGEFLPIRALRPDLPPALDAWFARALAVDPDTRFFSVDELRETFCAITDAPRYAFSPAPTTLSQRSDLTARELRQRPLRAVRASVAALAMTLIGAWAVWG